MAYDLLTTHLLLAKFDSHPTDLTRFISPRTTPLISLYQCSTIEYKLVEQQVLDGIKTGNQVLQKLNEQMKVEDVERLMGETADAIAYQKVGACWDRLEALISPQIGSGRTPVGIHLTGRRGGRVARIGGVGKGWWHWWSRWWSR